MDERDYKTLVKASAHESLSLRRGVAAIYEGASVTVDPLFVLAGLPKASARCLTTQSPLWERLFRPRVSAAPCFMRL